MTRIPTTAGDMEATELGRTLSHEHLHCGSEAVRTQWPHIFDRDAELAEGEAEIRRTQEHGVATICDPSCMDLGRDVHLNIEITKRTGMRFVMATGVYGIGVREAPLTLNLNPDWPENLTELFVHDIQVGIQETSVRAGFLKCAADLPGLTPDIEAIHRAAARASNATGAPIMAHSNPAEETGLEQMRVFTEEGVPPSRVVIAHTGDTDNLDYIEKLLASGCFIGMDRFGLEPVFAEDRRVDTTRTLIERGHADQMMLSQDAVAQVDTGIALDLDSWHMTRIFEHTIPRLVAGRIAREELEPMIGSNVHRWLSGQA